VIESAAVFLDQELIPCHYSSCSWRGATLFRKKPMLLSFQIGLEWNVAGSFFM